MNKECKLNIEGMHCKACEMLLEDKISQIDGVHKTKAGLSDKTVILEIDEEVNLDFLKCEINSRVEVHGYKVVDEHTQTSGLKSKRETLYSFLAALAFILVFYLLQKLGITTFFNPNQINLPAVFTLGIIASLSSCMAVVGGLVLAISADYGNKKTPLTAFHASRLVSFFILGGVIGLIGKAFTLNPTSYFILSILLFAAMFINGIYLLNLFPSLKLSLTMPKFFTKNALAGKNTPGHLAPALLGLLTFFLPCGFTQSMQIYTLSTGNFLEGGITMMTFALGTLPALALISVASVKINEKFKDSLIFNKTAGFIVIFFALLSLIGALSSVGIIRPLFHL